VHVGSYGRRNYSCTISAQSVQELGSYGNHKFPISHTWLNVSSNFCTVGQHHLPPK